MKLKNFYKFKQFYHNQNESASLEYILLIFLIALTLVVTLSSIGDSNLSNYESFSERIDTTLNDAPEPNGQDVVFLENSFEEPYENAQEEEEKN